MYENYSKQALPSKEYRELLGSALCVFNSNNQFVIENILRIDPVNYNWFELIDIVSGNLSSPIKETITKKTDTKIAKQFSEICEMRNRIVHSFQVEGNGEQILRTKNKKNEQFDITESYLMKFIKKNDELSRDLHKFRGF